MQVTFDTPARREHVRGSQSPTHPKMELQMAECELSKSVTMTRLPDHTSESSATAGSSSDGLSVSSHNTAVSLFDRKKLLQRIEQARVPVKSQHLEKFFEVIYRHHFPPLKTFLADYCRYLVAKNVSSDASVRSSSSEESGISVSQKRYRRLSPHLVRFLLNPNQSFETLTSRVVSTVTSKTGNCIRINIELCDGHVIETMLMRYRESDGSVRGSVSLSSQIGCSRAYPFQPENPFRRNLTASEILEQVVHATHVLIAENPVCQESRHLIQNVTFMGCGEPLDNYDNVVEACYDLADRQMWGLCRGRITIRTIGITPRIYELTTDLPDVILAVSLHAPNQELRKSILPVAKQYGMRGLMKAIENHMDKQLRKSEEKRRRRNVMLEYVLVEGETSSLECAHELGRLCLDRQLVVNLIPYTPTENHDDRRCPSLDDMKEFQAAVSTYGVLCKIRMTLNTELMAASNKLVLSPGFCDSTPVVEEPPVLPDIASTTKRTLRPPLWRSDSGEEEMKSADAEMFSIINNCIDEAQKAGYPETRARQFHYRQTKLRAKISVLMLGRILLHTRAGC